MVAAGEGQEAGLPEGDGLDGRHHAALTHHQLIRVGLLRVELLRGLLPRLGGDQYL